MMLLCLEPRTKSCRDGD